jgi:hypothetical protein
MTPQEEYQQLVMMDERARSNAGQQAPVGQRAQGIVGAIGGLLGGIGRAVGPGLQQASRAIYGDDEMTRLRRQNAFQAMTLNPNQALITSNAAQIQNLQERQDISNRAAQMASILRQSPGGQPYAEILEQVPGINPEQIYSNYVSEVRNKETFETITGAALNERYNINTYNPSDLFKVSNKTGETTRIQGGENPLREERLMEFANESEENMAFIRMLNPAPYPTQSEFLAAGFYDRLNQANQELNASIEVDGESVPLELMGTRYAQDVISTLAPGPLGRIMLDDNYRLYDQAKRNFINAVLRRESGAAIAPSEFASANMQYFPEPGDSQAVIDQKKRNRETVIKGMARESGRVTGGNSQTTPSQNQTISQTGSIQRNGTMVTVVLPGGRNIVRTFPTEEAASEFEEALRKTQEAGQ